MSNHLDQLEKATPSVRAEKAEQLSAKRWHNQIRLASARDVDSELRNWIAASYELSG